MMTVRVCPGNVRTCRMEPGGAAKNAVRCSLLQGPFRQDSSRDAGLPVLGEEESDTVCSKGRAAKCRDAAD